MNYRKHGLKALGLCFVAALGLMAFMASGAQAHWLVGGAALNLSEKPPILGHTLNVSLLLSTVGAVDPKIKVEIQCELIEVNTGYLNELAGEKLTVHATIKFSKACTTYLNLAANAKCAPLEPIEAEVKGTLILHGTPTAKTYILLVPLLTNFVTLHLGTGTCSIGLNFPITGAQVIECLVITCETEAVSHSISAVLPGLFPAADELNFGANKASFHGTGSLHLGGAFEGKKWAGVG